MFPVNEKCKAIFTAIKLKQKHAYAIMRIKDRKEIVVETSAEPLPDFSQETNEKLFNQMKEDILQLGEPCYILFDVRFQRDTGYMKDAVGFIYWCPDDISPWEKLIYASSNQRLKSEFKGVKSFEYHDTEEFNFKDMVKELIRKDRQ
ncbi:uncharacterized protein [Montipora foliosa]|uniref:uncharacterized protein isoform X2 n=1 Tax=Montipora foliosa TaxID=591990 RepID=UPI0035F18217